MYRDLRIHWSVSGLMFALGGAASVGMTMAQNSVEPSYTGCLELQSGSLFALNLGDRPIWDCPVGSTEVRLSAGDVTGVTPGSGITGGGDSGEVVVEIDPLFQLPQGCVPGELAQFGGNGWECGEAPRQQQVNSAAKVWVTPWWSRYESARWGGERTEVVFLNATNETASVRCIFFDLEGAVLLGAVVTRDVTRGAAGFCASPFEEDDPTAGWMLLVSDQPIMPSGRIWSVGSRSQTERSLPFYPIDCSRTEGVEFICSFVDP